MSWAQCDQICVYTLNLKLWVLWNDNSYAEILTTSVTVFRTRTFRKKSRLGEVSRVQVVSGDLRRPQKTFQEEEKPSPSPCEDRVGRQPSPSPEGSSQQNLTVFNSLTLNFRSPELWRSKFLLFTPASLLYFVMAAWAD